MLFDRVGPGADFEQVLAVQDVASGLRAILAIHSTRLGPAAGGIRRLAYASEEAALADALRLAEAMTLKCALAELPAGGAKTVLLDHPGLDRPAAYRALGRAIDSLGGQYLSGPDVGTGEAELAHVRKETCHVNPEGNDANASTAAGVLAGLRGTLRALTGAPEARGLTFVVQGLGGVGGAVAHALVQQGATVLGADPSEAARERARGLGVRLLDPEKALATPCDVFVPCALGGILDASSARTLPARAICGSANNQLAEPEAAPVLHARGVLHAPDFLVNAGAVIEGVLTTRHGTDAATRQRVRRAIAAIETRTREVLDAARREDRPPQAIAEDLARRRAR